VVTSLSLQPTRVTIRPPLRASRVVKKRLPLDRSGGDKTVVTQLSPQLVVVTLLSLQPTEVATQPLRVIWWCPNVRPLTGWVVTKLLSAAGWGDIAVTSTNRGGNMVTSTCELVSVALDRAGGDKKVSARPSPQLVGVTSLSFQPTRVATRPPLRASQW